LLQVAGEDRLGALYVLVINCGLRQGELLRLRWDDVGLAARILRLRRTLAWAESGHPVFTSLKIAKSHRSVKLTAGRR
jgi:integrase